MDRDEPTDAQTWPSRELLVLERQNGVYTDVLAARFADSNIRRVEVGQNNDGDMAVLWSFMNRCGSCHSGPEGVLLWNTKSNRYEWNDRFPPSIQTEIDKYLAKTANDAGDTSLDEAEAIHWDEIRSTIRVEATLRGSGAHCCPNGGTLSASLPFIAGELAIEDLSYHHARADSK